VKSFKQSKPIRWHWCEDCDNCETCGILNWKVKMKQLRSKITCWRPIGTVWIEDEKEING
jgi:hypothetical protein